MKRISYVLAGLLGLGGGWGGPAPALAEAAASAEGSTQPAPEAAKPKKAGSETDVDAIEKLIRANIDLSNNPRTAGLSLKERIDLGRRFHRPDASYDPEQLPLYFGTRTAPVLRGAEAYLRVSELEFEAFRQQGYRFEIQIDEMQIFQEGTLAVVVATPQGVITAPGGEVLGGAPARWTLALEKSRDGRWFIFHEHLSFFTDDGKTDERVKELERVITRLSKRSASPDREPRLPNETGDGHEEK